MFRLEAEMHRPVARWLQRNLLLTRAEFVTPSGPCDLVGVSLRPDRIALRQQLGQSQPIASLTRALILQRIPDVERKRWTTVRSVLKAFDGTLPPDVIMAEIKRLIADKFVTPRGRVGLQKVNGWAPIHGRIVAVELKLTRVSEALAQARCHLSFADESFIGLPRDLAVRVNATAERWKPYWDLGVGLLAVSTSECRILRPSKPDTASQDQALRMYVADKFWRRRSEAV